MVWMLLLTGLLVTGLTGVPIGIGLALTGLSILRFGAGGGEDLAITAVWNVFVDFTLSAVPIFIFMGEILLVSGVSSRIYNAVSPFFRQVPGGLLHTNIAVCTVFGAVSGASTSTAAAVGSVAYPELRNRGYNRGQVVATLAAGGTLGLLIPPSLSLLLYGATQGVSIGRLFLAGVLPGLMLASMFMCIIALRARRFPEEMGHAEPAMPLAQRLRGLVRIWPVAFLAFAVLGTMYMGLATPTEAAALGVVAAIITGFCWGELTLRKVGRAFFTSARVFGAIATVMLGALVLAQALTIMGTPQALVGAVTDMGLSKYAVLVFVVAAYLVLGCFFDGISLMLMTIPIVYPLMMAAGYDPVWTGVIITILIEIGMLTPPVGMNLFVLTAITNGEVSLGRAALAAIPYWIMMLVGVLILAMVPDIALWLPNLVMKGGT
ncbi:TRAP transporter large permease [Bordetella sp. BOR01]|uniref:TRAP transporter large permease n=1 Tax=Bordetella sp. BOR01 TaxID=2854779 RepID=UPI001C47C424|nr:TRAP transporter large permease [Bordetella sp. BOR01]MBV7485133.1 TRAP transporter large permease [Bordetella sp. BOR01]